MTWWLLGLVGRLAPALACFVLGTALLSPLLSAGTLEASGLDAGSELGLGPEPTAAGGPRLWAGVALAFVLPLVLYGWVRARLAGRRLAAPGPLTFIAVVDALLVLAVGLGFADDAGRALRRHGDWFLGERRGAVARGLRVAIARAALALERFDPPPALEASLGQGASEPARPPRPDAPRPEGSPEAKVAWVHPLAGPDRALPVSEGRRFGAARPAPRPAECELGHCGVDVGHARGVLVLAVADAVVERIERDAARGGRAGRYVRLAHLGGTVVTRYIHLDVIDEGLREGDTVRAGTPIGRVGQTGVHHSGPHLHFGLSLRPKGPAGDERYVDPEPLLRRWRVVEAPGDALARVD